MTVQVFSQLATLLGIHIPPEAPSALESQPVVLPSQPRPSRAVKRKRRDVD